MNEQELIAFIREAGMETYLKAGVMPSKAPLRPNCDEFFYERGDWRYHDSYAWKMDGGGEILVYYKGAPVWVLNYFGYLIGVQDTKEVYGFLHDALKLTHRELPVRGDTLVDAERGLRYEVEYLRAEVGNFVGVEKIFKNDVQAYEGYIHGGFVR